MFSGSTISEVGFIVGRGGKVKHAHIAVIKTGSSKTYDLCFMLHRS